jgi:hypothetical protein
VTISPAGSVTTVTVSNATFDGGPHGATATVTGAGGLSATLTVTYTGRNGTVYNSTTAPTAAGDYTASASYPGDTDHTGSGNAANFTIAAAKAATVTTVAGGAFTYDGTAHGATAAAVTGPGGFTATPTLVYKDAAGSVLAGPPTNAGTFTVCATYAGDATHSGSTATATITINKAVPTVTVVGGTFQANNHPHAATGSVTGVNGANLGTPTLTYSYNRHRDLLGERQLRGRDGDHHHHHREGQRERQRQWERVRAGRCVRE